MRMIRNAIPLKVYVETYLRNNSLRVNPSSDNVFRRIANIRLLGELKGGSRRLHSALGNMGRGSQAYKRISNHEGLGAS